IHVPKERGGVPRQPKTLGQDDGRIVVRGHRNRPGQRRNLSWKKGRDKSPGFGARARDIFNKIVDLVNFSRSSSSAAEWARCASRRKTRCSALEGDSAIDRVAHLKRFPWYAESDREREFFRA